MLDAVAMRESGRSPAAVVGTWTACAVLLALAVVLGRAIGGGLSDEVLAVTLGFAGGAVLASLADTLMPEAYRDGGPWVAYFTALGFLLSFLVSAA